MVFDATSKFETKQRQFEEDGDNTTIDQNEYLINRSEIFRVFLDIIKGKPQILTRSANILHVLGSVTVRNAS